MEDYSYLFKIILIGDANVGKTCLVRRFAKGYFPPGQSPTIGVDFSIKTVEVDGEKVKLQIWDTAGQERFRSVTQSYYHNADGVIIVYDITSKRTFESIPKWLEDVNRFSSKNVLMAVVGNKCDLENQKQVDPSVAKLYAESENCVSLETSAKESDNVELLFMSMATELKRNVKSAADSAEKETGDDKPANGFTIIGGHTIYSRGPVSCCRV